MKIKLFGFIAAIFVIIFAIIVFLNNDRDESAPIVSTPNLRNHPVYSGYEFNNVARVICFGIQPLYLPTSLITEAFKRDIILNETLNKAGLVVRYYDFFKGDDVNFFLRSGDLDIGIGGDMPAITAAATCDIVIPAMIQQGFVSIVATRYMLIKALRGRSIGYAFGSNAHYALLNTLSSAGLGVNQVNLVPMEVSQMPEALSSGDIAAFSAWEPTPTITLNKYAESVVIHQSYSQGFLYCRKAFYNKYPQAVFHIAAAEIRAIKWMQRKRQNLLRACNWAIKSGELFSGTKGGLSAEEIAGVADKDILGEVLLPIITEDMLAENGHLHREFKFLKDLDSIPPSVKWAQIRGSFDPKILDKVRSNPQKYRLNEFNYLVEGKTHYDQNVEGKSQP